MSERLTMTADEWCLVKQVFDASLDRPEAERATFVASACGSQPVVHAAVLELLEFDRSETRLSGGRAAADDHVLAPGQLVAGRFRVTRLIAAGGMGEVFEVWDEWLRLKIALKTLRPELLGDAEALQRFKRELLVARGVAHENVCRVFDFVEHRPESASGNAITPCFTMELLEGESLAELLCRRRPLPPDEALHIARQVACGLSALHDRGIIHRDLKPSNIMIAGSRNGLPRVVVSDFGLAKSDAAGSELFESAPEMPIGGAPFFMAPELLRKQRPTVASDIYALGLLIDEMVTSTRIFSARSLQALFYEKLWEKPLPPSDRSVNLPPHWCRTILRCLEQEPAARFADVTEVIRALEQSEPVPATAVLPVIPAKTASAPLLSRRKAVAALIGLPLAGGIATVGALAFQPINASVEVFDVENQTGRNDLNYLCRGTTQELMRRLLQLQGVRVFSMHATRMAFAGRRAGRFSLDGMLQAHDGQIRLSMKLTDNDNQGDLIWSDNFDRQGIRNPLDLQMDIANNVVASLEKRMLFGNGGAARQAGVLSSAAYYMRQWFTLQTAAALPSAPTSSNEAFTSYMRGHNLLEELSPAGASSAIDYFRRAIDQDPRFALAHSSAAEAHMALMNYNYRPHGELAPIARDYATRAVQLDPTLAEAHCVLAAVRQMDWDWSGAESSYKEALRLKPNLAKARRWYAGLLIQFGRWDEAISEATRALSEDPYDRGAPPSVGLYLFLAGRYAEAVEMLQTAVQNKDMIMTRHNLGQVYAWLGHTGPAAKAAGYFNQALQQAEVMNHMERSASTESRTSFSDQLYALTFALKGDYAAAQPYVDRMEADINVRGASPVNLAWVYSIEGQTERSCDLLERAASWRDRRLLYSGVMPYLKNLRGSPRFAALLRRMKLAS